MIALLQGTVVSCSGATVTILSAGGVGYEVHATSAALATCVEGSTVSLPIYTAVSQDAIRLFGFADAREKQVFSLLLQVDRLGPKTAVEVLSHLPATELLRIVMAEDVERLQKVKGIGRKTAERIVLELKDKVKKLAAGDQDSLREQVVSSLHGGRGASRDALEALLALGFSRREAEVALTKVTAPPEDAGTLVAQALQFL